MPETNGPAALPRAVLHALAVGFYERSKEQHRTPDGIIGPAPNAISTLIDDAIARGHVRYSPEHKTLAFRPAGVEHRDEFLATLEAQLSQCVTINDPLVASQIANTNIPSGDIRSPKGTVIRMRETNAYTQVFANCPGVIVPGTQQIAFLSQADADRTTARFDRLKAQTTIHDRNARSAAQALSAFGGQQVAANDGVYTWTFPNPTLALDAAMEIYRESRVPEQRLDRIRRDLRDGLGLEILGLKSDASHAEIEERLAHLDRFDANAYENKLPNLRKERAAREQQAAAYEPRQEALHTNAPIRTGIDALQQERAFEQGAYGKPSKELAADEAARRAAYDADFNNRDRIKDRIAIETFVEEFNQNYAELGFKTPLAGRLNVGKGANPHATVLFVSPNGWYALAQNEAGAYAMVDLGPSAREFLNTRSSLRDTSLAHATMRGLNGRAVTLATRADGSIALAPGTFQALEPGSRAAGDLIHIGPTTKFGILETGNGTFIPFGINDIVRSKVGARGRYFERPPAKAALYALQKVQAPVVLTAANTGHLSFDAPKSAITIQHERELRDELKGEWSIKEEFEQTQRAHYAMATELALAAYSNVHDVRRDNISSISAADREENVLYRGPIAYIDEYVALQLCPIGNHPETGAQQVVAVPHEPWVLKDAFGRLPDIGQNCVITYPPGQQQLTAKARLLQSRDERLAEFIARSAPQQTQEQIRAATNIQYGLAVNALAETLGVPRESLPLIRLAPGREYLEGTVTHSSTILSFAHIEGRGLLPLEHNRLGRSFDVGDTVGVRWSAVALDGMQESMLIAKHERVQLSPERQQSAALQAWEIEREALLAHTRDAIVLQELSKNFPGLAHVDKVESLNNVLVASLQPVPATLLFYTNADTYFGIKDGDGLKVAKTPTFERTPLAKEQTNDGVSQDHLRKNEIKNLERQQRSESFGNAFGGSPDVNVRPEIHQALLDGGAMIEKTRSGRVVITPLDEQSRQHFADFRHPQPHAFRDITPSKRGLEKDNDLAIGYRKATYEGRIAEIGERAIVIDMGSFDLLTVDAKELSAAPADLRKGEHVAIVYTKDSVSLHSADREQAERALRAPTQSNDGQSLGGLG